MSHVTIIFNPCLVSHVEFKKCSCRHVDFRGPVPLNWCLDFLVSVSETTHQGFGFKCPASRGFISSTENGEFAMETK